MVSKIEIEYWLCDECEKDYDHKFEAEECEKKCLKEVSDE